MAHIKLKYVNAFANRGRKDKPSLLLPASWP